MFETKTDEIENFFTKLMKDSGYQDFVVKIGDVEITEDNNLNCHMQYGMKDISFFVNGVLCIDSKELEKNNLAEEIENYYTLNVGLNRKNHIENVKKIIEEFEKKLEKEIT